MKNILTYSNMKDKIYNDLKTGNLMIKFTKANQIISLVTDKAECITLRPKTSVGDIVNDIRNYYTSNRQISHLNEENTEYYDEDVEKNRKIRNSKDIHVIIAETELIKEYPDLLEHVKSEPLFRLKEEHEHDIQKFEEEESGKDNIEVNHSKPNQCDKSHVEEEENDSAIMSEGKFSSIDNLRHMIRLFNKKNNETNYVVTLVNRDLVCVNMQLSTWHVISSRS